MKVIWWLQCPAIIIQGPGESGWKLLHRCGSYPSVTEVILLQLWNVVHEEWRDKLLGGAIAGPNPIQCSGTRWASLWSRVHSYNFVFERHLHLLSHYLFPQSHASVKDKSVVGCQTKTKHFLHPLLQMAASFPRHWCCLLVRHYLHGL